MIHDVEWQKDAFERLIVKDNQKKILLPLVSAHAFPTDVRDGMQQKGKGLVVLLHGSPGSGKTLTAGS
jgi:ATP-dependent 26S proteasome regulatory subunit